MHSPALPPLDWAEVHRSLLGGDYAETLRLLEHIQNQTSINDDWFVYTSNAITNICQLCIQCQDAAEWHRLCRLEAEERELHFRRQMAELLLSLGSLPTSANPSIEPPPKRSFSQPKHTAASPSKNMVNRSHGSHIPWWRRVRQWFGLQPTPPNASAVSHNLKDDKPWARRDIPSSSPAESFSDHKTYPSSDGEPYPLINASLVNADNLATAEFVEQADSLNGFDTHFSDRKPTSERIAEPASMAANQQPQQAIPPVSLDNWDGVEFDNPQPGKHDERTAMNDPLDDKPHHSKLFNPAPLDPMPFNPAPFNSNDVFSNQEELADLLIPADIDLRIHAFGSFRVYQGDHLIENWKGFKGLSVFKYLVLNRSRQISKEMLLELFWPDADPEAARRNLHQAIYSLRQTLRLRQPEVQHILFERDHYMLNPALSIWIDVDLFERQIRYGNQLLNEVKKTEEQQTGDEADSGDSYEALRAFLLADRLYTGDLLAKDLYEEWTIRWRSQLRDKSMQLSLCLAKHFASSGDINASISQYNKILTREPCDESAHRGLMRCYSTQKQRHLAVRQYRTCVQNLLEQLDVQPSPETTELYQKITATDG